MSVLIKQRIEELNDEKAKIDQQITDLQSLCKHEECEVTQIYAFPGHFPRPGKICKHCSVVLYDLSENDHKEYKERFDFTITDIKFEPRNNSL